MDFKSEFKKLILAHPHAALTAKAATHAAFSDYVVRSKNIYLSFFITDSEDCYYSDYASRCRDCVDCTSVESCELCYECFDCHSCRNTSFLVSCTHCSESEYLQNCYNCQNCFGCTGLINKQYCILNRQFTPEEYEFALQKLKKEMKDAGVYGKPLAEIVGGVL